MFDIINDPFDYLYKEQYTMITPYLAVGSLYSHYDEFDLIVNMAYRYDGDGFLKHQITTTNENGKMIIRIGIHDTPLEPLYKILPDIIPILLNALQDNKKILIHCQAGMSRSASVAIALVAKYDTLTFTEALRYVKEKRPIVKPNEGFYKMVQEYLTF